MNLSTPFICEFFKDAQEKFLPYMDFVFGNETEAREPSPGFMAGRYRLSYTTKFQQAVLFCITEEVEQIAIKISQLAKAMTKHPVIPLSEEKLVDINGAGDVFVGGFMSQLEKEKSIEECVKVGCYASNVVIQRSGCTYPDKPDLN
ncbi:hypothetical protein N665_0319s0018 [Sinapis alba]|nr:hypothetical protein N665_0319s0018 [Sinapis alba]